MIFNANEKLTLIFDRSFRLKQKLNYGIGTLKQKKKEKKTVFCFL